jgi:hypothetical protein
MTNITKTENKEITIKQTAQALKQHFLDNAHSIIDEYIGAALGTGDLKSNNSGAREEVWNLVKQLIMQSSDKLDLKVESPEDVLVAVSNGACTIKEGEALLKMYKSIKEIDTMGNLSHLGEGSGGLVINIQASGQPVEVEVPVQQRVIEGDVYDAD